MKHFIKQIDISGFLKSRTQFEKYRQNLTREQDRAGAIQAFEYTYEMAWKTMKRLLTQQGITQVNSPRQCFREAAKIGLISDPTTWFYFIDIRNFSVHTYNEKIAQQIVDNFEAFSLALNEFVDNLEKIQ